MKKYIGIIMLCLILMLQTSIVLADESSSYELTVYTSKASYTVGDKIVINGKVVLGDQAVVGGEVALVVRSESGDNLYFIDQLVTSEDGSFTTQFIASSYIEKKVNVIVKFADEKEELAVTIKDGQNDDGNPGGGGNGGGGSTPSTPPGEDNFNKYKNDLSKAKVKPRILNANKRMTHEKANEIKQSLKNNRVNMAKEAGIEKTIISDSKQEVSVMLPEKVLKVKKKITVNELDEKQKPKQYAVKVSSSIYEFGPKGTKFDKNISIQIKLPITTDLDIHRLTPAWYDEEEQKWEPIAGVIDVETGIVTFEVDHFTKFAVIEKPERVEFDDVDKDFSWAVDAIEVLAGKGIIKGTGQGFEPRRSITRAEFVSLIVGALDLSTDEGDKRVFSDVQSTDWFSQAVKTASNNDIVSGDGNGKFRPNDEITRNEIASIFYKLDQTKEQINNDVTLKDYDKIPNWALDGVKYVYNEGLMKGYDDKEFKGNRSLSRAEAAVVIYRYLDNKSN